jgi:hypothetical protein
VAKIVQARSAAGLSALSFELESWVLLVHCVYGGASGLPFSAYGEAVLLLVQTLLIVGLIYRWGEEAEGKRGRERGGDTCSSTAAAASSSRDVFLDADSST